MPYQLIDRYINSILNSRLSTINYADKSHPLSKALKEVKKKLNLKLKTREMKRSHCLKLKVRCYGMDENKIKIKKRRKEIHVYVYHLPHNTDIE